MDVLRDFGCSDQESIPSDTHRVEVRLAEDVDTVREKALHDLWISDIRGAYLMTYRPANVLLERRTGCPPDMDLSIEEGYRDESARQVVRERS